MIAFGGPKAGQAVMLARLATARRTYDRERPAELRLDVGKMFSQTYLLKLATLLPSNEIAVLMAAEELREQALALARHGGLVEAAGLLRRAAILGDSPTLSEHARIAARSFQHAAQAYLAYRQGRHGDAIGDLERAIGACDDLGDHFGDILEFRRIHLARNILRVRCRSAPSERVVADSVDLLYYITGDAACWPLEVGRGVGNPGRLSAAQRGWAIDETIVNLALDPVDIGAGRASVPRFVHRQGLDVHLLASFEWCDALMAWRAGDQRSFARHAINFFDHRTYDLALAGKVLDGIIDTERPSP